MQMQRSRVALLASLLLYLSACSTMQSARHEYLMRGQVVAVSGPDVVVCVGWRDGARVGQDLTAYRLAEASTGGPGKDPSRWERVRVGTVRLMEVVDEHFG